MPWACVSQVGVLLKRLNVTRYNTGVTTVWAGWTKSRGLPSAGTIEFQAKKNKNNFTVTVKIRTSGYQALECFIATLPT